MPRLSVGEKIPDHLYERVMDRNHANYFVRQCRTCKKEYTTAEVALVKGWTGKKANRCPQHQQQNGWSKMTITITTAQRGNYMSYGLMGIVALGGVYRRRYCPRGDCERESGSGKPITWTTGELSPTGLVVEDISRCPRCGGPTKVRRGKKGIPSV